MNADPAVFLQAGQEMLSQGVLKELSRTECGLRSPQEALMVARHGDLFPVEAVAEDEDGGREPGGRFSGEAEFGRNRNGHREGGEIQGAEEGKVSRGDMAGGATASGRIARDENQEGAILKFGSQGLADGSGIRILLREGSSPHIIAGEIIPRLRFNHGSFLDQPGDGPGGEEGRQVEQFTVWQTAGNEQDAVCREVLKAEERDGSRGHSDGGQAGTGDAALEARKAKAWALTHSCSGESSSQTGEALLDPAAMSSTPTPEARARYWRKNLSWLGGLLAVWFIVSYGCGILFVDQLDTIRIPGTGFKLGFWFAQQGSIYVFLVLIAVYVFVMNRLDRELLGAEGDDL